MNLMKHILVTLFLSLPLISHGESFDQYYNKKTMHHEVMEMFEGVYLKTNEEGLVINEDELISEKETLIKKLENHLDAYADAMDSIAENGFIADTASELFGVIMVLNSINAKKQDPVGYVSELDFMPIHRLEAIINNPVFYDSYLLGGVQYIADNDLEDYISEVESWGLEKIEYTMALDHIKKAAYENFETVLNASKTPISSLNELELNRIVEHFEIKSENLNYIQRGLNLDFQGSQAITTEARKRIEYINALIVYLETKHDWNTLEY